MRVVAAAMAMLWKDEDPAGSNGDLASLCRTGPRSQKEKSFFKGGLSVNIPLIRCKNGELFDRLEHLQSHHG